MNKQQLPEGLRMVKFGEMAKHISKRVEPSETDLAIYVGLEHLDPDSLRIKRQGVPGDVAGQKLLVKKGQIIFGKRRAYQRKLGVADWDCICSAHAMVLEANPEKVLPEFLPFFMQSDVFMNRAVTISEGSLSLTIKWKTLAIQKFGLPSIDVQKKIANLLSNLANTEKKVVDVLDSAFSLHNVLSVHTAYDSEHDYVHLDDICQKIQDGTHFSPKTVSQKGDFLYVTSKNIRMGRMELSDKEYVTKEEHDSIYKRCDVKKGDILLTKDGVTTGNCCINDLNEQFSLLSSVALIRVNPNMADRDFSVLLANVN